MDEAAGVRSASREDVPRLATALARAFADDPGFSHLLPDPTDRAARLEVFFRTELGGFAFDHGHVWTTENVVGVAVWTPPGAWRVPVTATLREVPAAMRVFRRRLPLALRSRLRMEHRHPSEPPHWYLAVMGVDPEWQGRGLGTALMRPVLDQLDAEGMSAYLEASTLRSRALYERNGFDVTAEFNLPADGPPLWAMWREAAGGRGAGGVASNRH
jgi:ribosomal protein S18 acetylase RimI-like enzyme